MPAERFRFNESKQQKFGSTLRDELQRLGIMDEVSQRHSAAPMLRIEFLKSHFGQANVGHQVQVKVELEGAYPPFSRTIAIDGRVDPKYKRYKDRPDLVAYERLLKSVVEPLEIWLAKGGAPDRSTYVAPATETTGRIVEFSGRIKGTTAARGKDNFFLQRDDHCAQGELAVIKQYEDWFFSVAKRRVNAKIECVPITINPAWESSSCQAAGEVTGATE